MTSYDYDERFWRTIRQGCQESAAAALPHVLAEARCPSGRPLRVVDVGCGEGWWARAFAERGHDVLGVDGAYVERRAADVLAAAGAVFVPAELELEGSLSPLPHDFDLALSLEVAEHLPPERSESFVRELCGLAPVVVFSAAIPHQGGHGHVACRWQSEWARLFAQQGYDCDTTLRERLWQLPDVKPWYSQNVLLATRQTVCTHELFLDIWEPPPDVVHPRIWEGVHG